MNDKKPINPPFKHYHGIISIEHPKCGEARVLDVRGWGFLIGKGCGGLGLPSNEASKIQDEFAKKVVRILNENWDE